MVDHYIPLCTDELPRSGESKTLCEEIVNTIIESGTVVGLEVEVIYKGYSKVNGPINVLIIDDGITIRLYRIDREPFSAWASRLNRNNLMLYWSHIWEKLEGQYLEATFDVK